MADLDSQPKSIQSLYGWYSEGKLFVNRRYQRKLVWTLEEKQRLIESIFNKYPIPAILLAERADGAYEIIDGLQRLFSIVSFIETAFTTLDDRYFDVAKFPTAAARAEGEDFTITDSTDHVSAKEVTTLLDYTLAISVMRGASEAEIDDVFGRINTYGHRLSDQERRQAGVQDNFSETVRNLACVIRGDASSEILNLSQMPSISIDLPKTKHGYDVRADEVFWVQEGVLRSTDLRDSMDEQCIADIAACIVGGQLIERSKDALDRVYLAGDPENTRIGNALNVHGQEELSDELKFCIDEIRKVSKVGTSQKLRDMIFANPNNNGFPALFATIVIAFHEALIAGKQQISDYAGLKASLTKLDSRIATGRGSTAVAERRKNVDVVKGLLAKHVVPSDLKTVYNNHSVSDIDAAIRRSEIELPDYELKQGMLTLSDTRIVDTDLIPKVVRTICAIANNGPGRGGTLFVGVTDKPADSARVAKLDSISPRKVGSREIVGIKREAEILGESTEDYFGRWKAGIQNSDLTSPLKEDVLSSISYHDYFGLGVIVISVPPQHDLSYVGSDLFMRVGDETKAVKDAKTIAGLIQRFA